MKFINLLSFIYRVTRPFLGYIIGIFFSSIGIAVTFMAIPNIVKQIVNTAITTHPSQLFLPLSHLMIVYLIVSIGIVAFFRLSNWFALQFFPKQKELIFSVLTQEMMKHSMEFYKKHLPGNLMNKINDVNDIPEIIKIVVDKLAISFFSFFFMFYSLWMVEARFAIALFFWSAIFIGGGIWFLFKNKNLPQIFAESRANVAGQIVDVLTHMLSIRLFSRFCYESKRLKKNTLRLVNAEQNQERFFMHLSFFQGISFVLFEALCFWWLLNGISNGKLVAGDFVLIFSVNGIILDLFWDCSKEIRVLWQKLGYIRQALSMIFSAVEIKDLPHAKDICIEKGEVVFDHVQFFYMDTHPLFEDKSICLKGKQKIGLVGYSGSGKTTFINLILRLYDVSSGRILIDEQDIKNITQESLHQSIAMIPQECNLFNRSLMENIRYGRLDASDEEVKMAARQSYIHDMIESLPESYATIAGEKGAKLSGGQRQLIAVARAILKNAPILILDEATSNLDVVTERKLQKSLMKLMQDKTVFVVAHRLSTLLNMDRILVFDEGTIVQDGTHEELLGCEGLYRQFWETQVNGFLLQDKQSDFFLLDKN